MANDDQASKAIPKRQRPLSQAARRLRVDRISLIVSTVAGAIASIAAVISIVLASRQIRDSWHQIYVQERHSIASDLMGAVFDYCDTLVSQAVFANYAYDYDTGEAWRRTLPADPPLTEDQEFEQQLMLYREIVFLMRAQGQRVTTLQLQAQILFGTEPTNGLRDAVRALLNSWNETPMPDREVPFSAIADLYAARANCFELTDEVIVHAALLDPMATVGPP